MSNMQIFNHPYTIGSRDWPAAKSTLEELYASAAPDHRLQIINEFKIAYDYVDANDLARRTDIEAHIRDTIMRKRSQNPKERWKAGNNGLWADFESLAGVVVE